jgi:hypothetical protein
MDAGSGERWGRCPGASHLKFMVNFNEIYAAHHLEAPHKELQGFRWENTLRIIEM